MRLLCMRESPDRLVWPVFCHFQYEYFSWSHRSHWAKLDFIAFFVNHSISLFQTVTGLQNDPDQQKPNSHHSCITVQYSVTILDEILNNFLVLMSCGFLVEFKEWKVDLRLNWGKKGENRDLCLKSTKIVFRIWMIFWVVPSTLPTAFHHNWFLN